MRWLVWLGIALLILGIISFLVPLPVSHSHTAKLGDASISVTTHDHEKLSPAVGGVLCGAGVVLLIFGSRKPVA